MLPDAEAGPTGTILVVDDTPANVLLLEAVLSKCGHNVVPCTDPTKALALLGAIQADLVILDLHMPAINGYELLKTIRSINPGYDSLPILVFTADITQEARFEALKLGASDFLTKPGEPAEIELRVRNFLRTHALYKTVRTLNEELERKVADRTRAIWESQLEVLERLARVASSRDDQNGDHSRRVATLAAEIAVALGLPNAQVELIRLTAPLHDIGKVGIPDPILFKRGTLLDHELTVMRTHTSLGGDIMSGGRTQLTITAEAIARTHHERWDGSGYPRGLIGKQIPIEGRIVAVADVFNSLTNERRYRKRMNTAEAISYIITESGKRFDPAVVRAFLTTMASKHQTAKAS